MKSHVPTEFRRDREQQRKFRISKVTYYNWRKFNVMFEFIFVSGPVQNNIRFFVSGSGLALLLDDRVLGRRT